MRSSRRAATEGWTRRAWRRQCAGDAVRDLENRKLAYLAIRDGWRYFNVAEDVWPRSERQVDHQDDETGHNDHRGRAPPALKVGDRAGQRGKRHLPGEPERHHIRDDHQEDREQAVDDVAEHVHVAAGSSG